MGNYHVEEIAQDELMTKGKLLRCYGTLKMNRGGFSWKRLLGISALKAKISRKIGIPLTQSGRERKIGALVIKCLRLLFSEQKRKKNN